MPLWDDKLWEKGINEMKWISKYDNIKNSYPKDNDMYLFIIFLIILRRKATAGENINYKL